MLSKVSCPILADDTSASLYQKLAELGPQALLTAIADLPVLQQQAEVQDEKLANYAEKLSKEEAKLDFSKDAATLEREIRAFNPWPVSYLELPQGTVKIWQAQVASSLSGPVGSILKADKTGIYIGCQQQVLQITQLQPPGKKPMSAADFLNGRADWLAVGQQL